MQKSTRHCVTQPMYLKFLSLHSPSCSVLWLHLLTMRFLFRVFNSFSPFSRMFFPTFYLWPAPWNLVQLFHYRGLECKSSKSRNTWNNRWIWPWNTKQSRSKANRVLQRGCTGHSKHPFPVGREDSTHEHPQMVNA